MRKFVHIEGRKYQDDSENDATHVVIGKRNEEVEFVPPPQDALKEQKENPERFEARVRFVNALTSGRFRIKTLKWGTEDESQSAAKEFMGKISVNVAGDAKLPTWINVSVQKIADIGRIQPNA